LLPTETTDNPHRTHSSQSQADWRVVPSPAKQWELWPMFKSSANNAHNKNKSPTVVPGGEEEESG